MKKLGILIAMTIMSVALFGFSPSDFAPSEYYTVSANSGLNIRLTPGNGMVIGKLYLGDRVEIIADTDSLGYHETIDYVSGDWVKINHDNIEGYVFSGFLSSMPMPLSEEEFTSYFTVNQTFNNYMQNNFEVEATNYTVLGSTKGLVVEYYENGTILKKVDSDSETFLYGQVPNVKPFELYHILFAMLQDEGHKEAFLQNSIFVENNQGVIDQIKIQTNGEEIIIKQNEVDWTRIEMTSSHEGC